MARSSLQGWEFSALEATCPEFQEVLDLRSKMYARPEAGIKDKTDSNSLHVIGRYEGKIEASLRITPSSRTLELPLESQFPEWLIADYRPYIAGGSRFCLSKLASRFGIVGEEIIRTAWTQILPMGYRLIASPIREDLIPYYYQMGCIFVREHVMEFDAWNIQCGLGILPADLQRVPQFRDVFDTWPETLNFRQLYDSEMVATSRSEMFSLQRLLRGKSHEASL
jgi:hypothetical protein